MNKTHCGLALIISLIAFSYAQADICEPYPPKGMKAGYTYKGIYANGAYGYSIEIPKGHTGGLYQDPAAPQHGIQVILSWKPRSNIYFSGHANSLENKETDKPLDAFGYCLYGLNTVREYAKDVKSFEMRKSKLGSFNSYQYTIRYTCPKSSQERIEETVVAIPKGRGLVYRVTLETTMNRFKKDHKVFHKMVSSWCMIEWK
jgi:hypothetical protein